MVAPVALADRTARDPALAGVKAARLAAAAGAGLPVLPGWVIPLDASSDAVARGVKALEVGSGAPAAYLAAMESTVPPDLAEELAPRATLEDQLLVVRSSTLLDDDGRWSGAFTSYLGVGASDLTTAVRGCWASAFSTDALARCRETGIEVGSLRIGVLVQPFLAFEAGGTARVLEDGTAIVTAARGGPAGVVGGRGGGPDVVVGADGRVLDASDVASIGAGTVEAAAALALLAGEAVGARMIEWGAIGDELFLLQIGPAPPDAAAFQQPSHAATMPVRMPADAERLARLVTAFPGPVGEDLVFPWALGSGDVPDAERIRVSDPASALREARASSSELAAEAWETSPGVARERAAVVARLLLAGRVSDGCREIRDLPAPDTAAARRVVGLLRGVGAFLADAGVIPSASLIWRLPVSELERAISGDRPSLRRGPGRWEPFVADVVRSRGLHATGTPVSPGIAAGRPHLLRELRAIGHPGPREVLVTPLPLPHLAPLLWHSAALVSIGGSSGAHLFEVARSLGVPAVIGVDPAISDGGAGSLVAVDGDPGMVSILPPGGTPSLPSPDDVRAMV
jgi:phosphohistidine swiveling domain-containing protein